MRKNNQRKLPPPKRPQPLLQSPQRLLHLNKNLNLPHKSLNKLLSLFKLLSQPPSLLKPNLRKMRMRKKKLMRTNFSMMRKMRILMMISKKMMVKMTRMRMMRKRKHQKESLKVNPKETTSLKETKLSPSVETKKDSKEVNPSVEIKKVTKVANPISITIMVETETLTREDNKVVNLTSITTTVETETTSTTIEVEAMVESLLSIRVVTTGRIIKEETKTGKIIKEESLSTKETDSHSFIATNQFSLVIITIPLSL